MVAEPCEAGVMVLLMEPGIPEFPYRYPKPCFSHVDMFKVLPSACLYLACPPRPPPLRPLPLVVHHRTPTSPFYVDIFSSPPRLQLMPWAMRDDAPLPSLPGP